MKSSNRPSISSAAAPSGSQIPQQGTQPGHIPYQQSAPMNTDSAAFGHHPNAGGNNVNSNGGFPPFSSVSDQIGQPQPVGPQALMQTPAAAAAAAAVGSACGAAGAVVVVVGGGAGGQSMTLNAARVVGGGSLSQGNCQQPAVNQHQQEQQQVGQLASADYQLFGSEPIDERVQIFVFERSPPRTLTNQLNAVRRERDSQTAALSASLSSVSVGAPGNSAVGTQAVVPSQTQQQQQQQCRQNQQCDGIWANLSSWWGNRGNK